MKTKNYLIQKPENWRPLRDIPLGDPLHGHTTNRQRLHAIILNPPRASKNCAYSYFDLMFDKIVSKREPAMSFLNRNTNKLEALLASTALALFALIAANHHALADKIICTLKSAEICAITPATCSKSTEMKEYADWTQNKYFELDIDAVSLKECRIAGNNKGCDKQIIGRHISSIEDNDFPWLKTNRKIMKRLFIFTKESDNLSKGWVKIITLFRREQENWFYADWHGLGGLAYREQGHCRR